MTSALLRAALVYFPEHERYQPVHPAHPEGAAQIAQIAWSFAFWLALLFVSAVQVARRDAHHRTRVLSFAAGFATGLVVGMRIEERLALGALPVRIITASRGARRVWIWRYSDTSHWQRWRSGHDFLRTSAASYQDPGATGPGTR